MDISQIGEPRGSSPRLLRIPGPIVAPSFLSPECSEENTHGHEGPTYLHEVVADVHLVIVDGGLLEPQQVGRHQRRSTEHSVGEHIDDDVRCEPRALERRHERLVVDLGVDDVDRGEDSSKDGAEA